MRGTEARSAPLVEHTSRYVILARMDGTDAGSALDGFNRRLRHAPAVSERPSPMDRGKEMALHKELARRLSIRVYFADPYSPWQRGTNENTNGLIRQYLPKGSDLSGADQMDLNRIAQLLNMRPRKCLGFPTPFEVYRDLIRKYK